MADAYQTNPKSNELSVGRQAIGSHLVVAKGRYMQDLALPTFDSDSIQYWVEKGNVNPFVINPAFVPEEGEPPNNLTFKTILAYNDGTAGTGETVSEDDGFLNINVWRTRGRNGEYIFVEKFSDWEFEDTYGLIDEQQAGRIWTHDELLLSEVPFLSPFGRFEEEDDGTLKSFTERILNLNEYINDLLIQDDSGDDPTVWENQVDKLRREFLVDIMSSKEGCINWTANLKLSNIGLIASEEGQAETATVSESTQRTAFALYLFSSSDPISPERVVSLKNFDIVGKRSHYGFGDFLGMEDGKSQAISDLYDPRSEVAGRLSTNYTEFLGEFEAGSPQLIAVLSTDLAGAEGPSIEAIEFESIDSLLDKEAGQEIVFGSAIPLHMQNSNPRQWSPIYRSFESDRRPDDFSKATLKVANLSPTNYTRGDMVILNRIEGLWFPLGIVSSGDLTPKAVENRDPKWEFMYLMTNAQFHFRDKQGEMVTPDEYEKGFYVKYYKDSTFADNADRYDSDFEAKCDTYNEFFQITSWDMMGDAIGGLRTLKDVSPTFSYLTNQDGLDYQGEQDLLTNPGWVTHQNGNAISNTEYYGDVDGKAYDDEVRNTYPFFGCTFPDGYNTSSFLDKVSSNITSLDESDNPEDADASIYSVINPRSGKAEYLHFLPTSGNIIANNNDVTVISSDTHQTLGMFYNVDGTALSHLPADIATNASPSGSWGYPLSDITMFNLVNDASFPDRAQTNVSFSGDLHNALFESGVKLGHQNRYGWVYDKPSSEIGETPVSGKQIINSTYDLQPTRFTRIQFRPLTKELYSFLERSNIGTTPDAPARTYPNFEYTFNPPPTEGGAIGQPGNYSDRGGESERLWQGCGSNSPVSKVCVQRNLFRMNEVSAPDEFGLTPVTDSLVGWYGLRYGSDLPEFVEDDILDDKNQGYPYLWWRYGWMDNGVSDGNLSAGGIGIIGATMSLRSVGTLTLSTENVHLEDFPIAGGGTQRSLNLGNYDEPNTSDLFMRCYQHWPRELTLYDPRYFVVHHFNPGVGHNQQYWDIATKESGVIIKDFTNNFEDLTAQNVNTRLREDGLIGENDTLPKGYSLPSGWFPIKKQMHALDLKVATSWTGGLANIGTKIYSDSTIDTGDIGEDGKIREKKDWWYNGIRQGKLLPYSYRYRTIGIAADEVREMDIGGGFLPSQTDIVIIERGEGYAEGQELTVAGGTGGGAVLTITEVDDDGGIVNVEMRSDNDQGFAYSPEDFAFEAELDGQIWKLNAIVRDADINIPVPPISKVTLRPFTEGENPAAGEGFRASVVRGTVIFSPLLTDQKPKEALDSKGPIRLSAFSRDNLSSNASNQFQITSPDSDNSYDLFFRFHNDISHVGFGSKSMALPNPRDQQITLTINNNIGLGAGAGDDINFNDPWTDLGPGAGGDDSFFGFLDNSDGDGTIGGAGGAGGGIDDFGFFN